MVTQVGYKEKASISVSTYLLRRAKELVEAGEFGSISDVFTTALTEFLANYESRKKARVQRPELTKNVVIE
jgi:Arc/MetJ-type ribon-helix-helix transcriptional regulator